MNLGWLYNFLNYIANKEQSGNGFTPEEFNRILGAVNLDYFKLKYGLPEQYRPGQPLPAQSYEITQKITDDLRSCKVWMGGPNEAQMAVDVYGRADIPSNYVHVSSVRYKYSVNDGCSATITPSTVEILTDAQIGDRLSNSIKMPTLKDPVCIFYSDFIQFYPINIGYIDFTYLRMPTTPVFGFDEVNYEVVYNASTSTEFDYPDEDYVDLARMLLGYIGINLREPQLQTYAEQHKQMGV